VNAYTSPEHKFSVGQQVKLHRMAGVSIEGGTYEITRLLPPEKNDFQYRIRAVEGGIDRVVFESQIL
jgi:hypothetical protein